MGKPSPLFPATRWSLVHTFQTGQEDMATRALAELCGVYWYPLYAHVRRLGRSPQDAEDLTQAFFHHLISKDTLHKVQEDGRKLRSFLLKSLQLFVSTSSRHDRALKRGGGQALVAFDHDIGEERYQHDSHSDDDPEILYERRWALTLMQNVLETLGEEFASKNKSDQFAVLRDMLMSGAQERSHRELADCMQTTEANARVTLYRARQRYGELLRSAIAETVATDAEVEDEIAHIIKVLGKS